MAPATPKSKLPMAEKILNAVASLAGSPNVKVSRKKVALRCGFAKKESKSYCNALGILKSKKAQIIYDKEFITILENGFEAADPEAPVFTNDDAIEAAIAKFKSKKQHQIINICSDGQAHTRAEIASQIGTDPSKKSFMNLLGPIKTNDFISYVKTADGEQAVIATETLLPFTDGGADL